MASRARILLSMQAKRFLLPLRLAGTLDGWLCPSEAAQPSRAATTLTPHAHGGDFRCWAVATEPFWLMMVPGETLRGAGFIRRQRLLVEKGLDQLDAASPPGDSLGPEKEDDALGTYVLDLGLPDRGAADACRPAAGLPPTPGKLARTPPPSVYLGEMGRPKVFDIFRRSCFVSVGFRSCGNHCSGPAKAGGWGSRGRGSKSKGKQRHAEAGRPMKPILHRRRPPRTRRHRTPPVTPATVVAAVVELITRTHLVIVATTS